MTKSSQQNVPDVGVDLGVACTKKKASPQPSYHPHSSEVHVITPLNTIFKLYTIQWLRWPASLSSSLSITRVLIKVAQHSYMYKFIYSTTEELTSLYFVQGLLFLIKVLSLVASHARQLN